MAFADHLGPRQDSIFPVAQGDATSSVFSALLGPPKRRMDFDPRHNLQQEIFSQTELFEGRLRYMGVMFRGMLFESHNPFMLRRLLPPVRRDDLNFVWQYYEFPRLPAIATAAQAPAHRVTAIRKSSTATMERYSLAVEDTAASQRTTEGQMLLAGKILSMAMGFIEMMEINGFRALLEQPAYYRRYWLEAQLHSFDFDAKVDVETWQFDALHKQKNGFASLLNAVRQDMAQSSDMIVNYVIIPEGTRGLIAAQPELQEYFQRGDGNQQFADALADAPDLRTTYPNTGIEWAVARGIEFDGADLYYDPLRRHVMIGSHFRMDFFGKRCVPGGWCTDNMSIGVFSMDDDRFVRITVEDAIKNCERFDNSDDGELHELHNDMARSAIEYANEANLPVAHCQMDMFLHHHVGGDGHVSFDVAKVWAQMEEWALSHDTTKRVAGQVAFFFEQRVGAAGIAAIAAGVAAIAEIWNAPVIVPRDEVFMRTSALAPVDGTFISAGSIGGGPRLPTADELDVALLGANYVPRGFGTAAGLIAIADDAGAGGSAYAYLNQTIVTRAVAFKESIGTFYDAAVELFTEKAVLLQAAYVPSAYAAAGTGEEADRSRRIVAFAANVVDGNKLPLVQTGGTSPPVAALAPPFDGLAGVIAAGAPVAVRATFSSPAALEAFKTEFASSPYGRGYAAYVTARARRGAGRARTVATADEDAGLAAAAATTAAGDVDGDLLTRFQRDEVAPRANAAGTNSVFVTMAIYASVIAAVRRKTEAPSNYKVSLDALSATATTYAASAGDRVAAPVEGYLTRLSVPFERVSGSASFGVASPLSNGRVLNSSSAAELAALRASSRADLDATTVFGSAHMRFGTRPVVGEDCDDGMAFGSDDGPLFGTARGPPSGAGELFFDTIVDGGRGRLVKNSVAAHRWTRAGKEANWLLRVSEQLFLLAPINRRVLLNLAHFDVPVPCAFLLEQPFHGLSTKAIIFVSLSSIDPLGETAFQDPDTHFSRDANRKTFYLHTSLYTASLVTDTRRYQVVPDAIVDGYRAGCNTKPIKMDEFDAAKVLDMNELSPGMFYIMVPAGSLVGRGNVVPRKHDIRGAYNPTVYKYRTDGPQASLAQGRPHYGSALWFNRAYNTADLPLLAPSEQLVFSNIESYANSVTLQGFQYLYLGAGVEPTAKLKPSDHFGDAVYPGCGKLRRNGAIAEVYPRDVNINFYAE